MYVKSALDLFDDCQNALLLIVDPENTVVV